MYNTLNYSRIDLYDKTSTNEEIEYEKYKNIPGFVDTEYNLLWFIAVEKQRLFKLEWTKYKNSQKQIVCKTIAEQEARELVEKEIWEKIQEKTGKKVNDFYQSIKQKNIQNSSIPLKSLARDT
jgi:hypothetical protein